MGTKKIDHRDDYFTDYPPLTIESNPAKPIELFLSWYEEAKEINPYTANIMQLATANLDHIPSIRTVLLREIEKDNLVFFTNYQSKKGKEIEENPKVACIFYWRELHRQVRLQGNIAKISSERSDRYFYSRPLRSQICSALSQQSSELENYRSLENKVNEVHEAYKSKQHYPRPKNWGGYIIRPKEWEFWIGKESRLHERLVYKATGHAKDGKEDVLWEKTNLQP